jgi:ATP/maltotriose-dependent transcriptional regulator MalT
MTTKKLVVPEPLRHCFCDLMSMCDSSRNNEDLVAVIRVLRAIMPNQPRLIVSEAWSQMNAGRLAEARALLDEAEERFPDDAPIKALKALCLHDQHDPHWHAYADLVRQYPDDEDAQDILRFLEKLQPVAA